jgi:tetratricopeptide (TPR) repeat protein
LALIERQVEQYGDENPVARRNFVGSRAAYVIDTQQWDNHYAGVEIDHEGLPPFSIATDHYVQGVVALKRGDISKAQAAFAAMEGEEEINSPDRETMAPLLLRLALEGQMALAAGQGEKALALIGKAAELEGQLPAEYGPAVPVQPMAELLADTYLVLGDTEKARHYYELSLESAVGRERSLSGLSKTSH